MPPDAAQMNAEIASEASEKGGGKLRLLTLADLDGRTRARKQADDAYAAMCSDLGGEDHLSTSRRLLAQHAAVMHAMAEDQAARFLKGEPVDVGGYATLTNSLRRLLETVGLNRVARDATPKLRNIIEGAKA